MEKQKFNATIWVNEFPFRTGDSSQINPSANASITVSIEESAKYLERFESFKDSDTQQVCLTFEDKLNHYSFKILCDFNDIFKAIESFKK